MSKLAELRKHAESLTADNVKILREGSHEHNIVFSDELKAKMELFESKFQDGTATTQDKYELTEALVREVATSKNEVFDLPEWKPIKEEAEAIVAELESEAT